MKPSHKTIILWGSLLVLFLLVVWKTGAGLTSDEKELGFSEFVQLVGAEQPKRKIVEVTIQGDEVTGKYQEGKKTVEFRTTGKVGEKLQERLGEKGIAYRFEPEEKGSLLQSLLITWLPMIFLFVVFFIFMRQLQVGGGKAMSFGKSKAKLLSDTQKRITFEDIAGIDEAKEELEEIIEFLKDPKRFTRLGGRIPKGVLLMGPPGTGKTLLARGVAGEAGVPFFSISGSDFVEMFVGVGASRVRDLFEQGKKHAPCIVFIDEIDAVGRHRGAGLGGGHDEREQTLNQLLVEMDGFESNDGVILVAATNRPDVLDPALLRPGRFDRRVTVALPDLKGRQGILDVHTRNKPVAEEVDLSVIARGSPGFSGADLENLVNEAALLAARRGKSVIDADDLDTAKDKVLMGAALKSRVISDKEKRTTAYHEAGHALVTSLIPDTDPIHKVTIIPRGQALGLTQQLPMEDRHSLSLREAQDMIAFLLGGRIAEEVALKQVTTGAGNDLERATGLARKMVCEWGMSAALGPLAYGRVEEQIFLGREISRRQDYSSETAVLIDQEVRRIIGDQYDRARKLVEEHRDRLEAMAAALLEFETLEGDEVELLVEGRSLDDLRTVRAERAEQVGEPEPLAAFNSELAAAAAAAWHDAVPQPEATEDGDQQIPEASLEAGPGAHADSELDQTPQPLDAGGDTPAAEMERDSEP